MNDDGLYNSPNTFQRLMLQWERFAPYNAAQYMTVAAGAPVVDPARAWRRTVVKLGLQQLGQHPDAPAASPIGTLDGHLTDEMNRPFAAGEPPFRPFVLRDEASLHLGIVYRHVVADSASIRCVMREWLARTFGVALSTSFITLDRSPGFSLFDATRRWSLVREATSELSRLSRVKRVRRLASVDPRQPIVWRGSMLPAGTLQSIIAEAKRESVRVNDVFLAAMIRAATSRVPLESSRSRVDIGAGTIVDTREGLDATTNFGLRLGFLQTFLDRGTLSGPWRSTLQAVGAASRKARERHAASASVLRLWAACLYGERMNTTQLADFYRKRCPLVGGISNVNLNRDWPGKLYPSPLLGYGRVSPTGPMLPLVITPTTLGDDVHLGFTYRTGDLAEADAQAIHASFIRQLTSLG